MDQFKSVIAHHAGKRFMKLLGQPTRFVNGALKLLGERIWAHTIQQGIGQPLGLTALLPRHLAKTTRIHQEHND